jgi:hypothetical protein
MADNKSTIATHNPLLGQGSTLSTLLKSVEKKGFRTARLLNAEQQLVEETCKVCPVKIIKATILEG